MSKKYKIIFDSNSLFYDQDELDRVFNTTIEKVFEFIEKENASVALCVPQLVIDERISQRLKEIDKQINLLNSSSKRLSIFEGFNAENKKFKKEELADVLNSKVKEYLKKYKACVVPTVKVDQDLIVGRALQKTPPFSSGNGKSDQGFKDTLIWLSLLKNAEEDSDWNYVLVTEDKAFNDEICKNEFKTRSKADFFVLKNILEIKEFLDNSLGLNLKLKELYDAVEQEVHCITGTITKKVIEYLTTPRLMTRAGFLYDQLNEISSAYNQIEKHDDFGNLNFKKLDITDMSMWEEDIFNVYADISFFVIKKEDKDPYSCINNFSLSMHRPEKIYVVNFIYNRKDKSIIIKSVAERLRPYAYSNTIGF